MTAPPPEPPSDDAVAAPAAAASSEGSIARVLVVVAHPDDETLTAGGLVAALAAHTRVTVVTCTRGERGEMIGRDLAHLLADRAELASHREGELERALTALGVAEHVYLDTVDGGPRLVDSGMRWDETAPHVRALPDADAGPDAFGVAPLERTVAALVTVLDGLQPDLVLVDEPGGGYGHPDHRRAHEVTMLAVERAVTRPAHVAWLVRPVGAVRAAQRWLRERNDRPLTGVDGQPLAPPAETDELPSIVVADDAVDVEVDVTPQLPALVAAMQAHRSQVQAVALVPQETAGPDAVGWFALSNGLLQPILRRAWLRSAPGWGGPDALRTAVERTLGTPTSTSSGGRWFFPVMLVFSAVLGLVLGAIGTAFHRTLPPWGLVAALAALVAGGLLARSFLDRAGQVAFGAGAVAVVVAMTYIRPGADLLITGQGIGVTWLIGSIPAALLLPALAPRHWFADRTP